MPRLLVVETSPRGDHSISRHMTRRFVAEWRQAHPEDEVVERDLMETDLPFVTVPWPRARFTPPERHSPEMRDALRLSDELVAGLLAADHLVIATQYLRLILRVIGIDDVSVIAAGGAKAVDLGEVGRDESLDRLQGTIEAEVA